MKTIRVFPLVLLAGCTAAQSPPPAQSSPQSSPQAPPQARMESPTPAPRAMPAGFLGDWAADAAACVQPGSESRLHIDGNRIRFHESSGPILSIDDGDGRMTLVARLTGEGETRDAIYRFTLSADGSTLTDGNGYVRRRCDAPQ